MRLLLVEDDAFFAQLIKEYLADNGLETTTVCTAHDALAISLDDCSGVVIDVMLPNEPALSGITAEEARGGCLSGVAVARRLRQVNKKLPIILMSSDITGGEAQRWARDNNVPFIFKYEGRSRLLSALEAAGALERRQGPRAFIVHGHDEGLLAELKDYIQNVLKWPPPVVLRDQPNAGKTIIEKFEDHAGPIDWVFVLLTPDDASFAPHSNLDRRRARQNVIFELGFFYGLTGRRYGRVVVLKKGCVELPSDIEGIAWIDIEHGIRVSGEDIRREVGH